MVHQNGRSVRGAYLINLESWNAIRNLGPLLPSFVIKCSTGNHKFRTTVLKDEKTWSLTVIFGCTSDCNTSYGPHRSHKSLTSG